jgi:hypothetical protein
MRRHGALYFWNIEQRKIIAYACSRAICGDKELNLPRVPSSRTKQLEEEGAPRRATASDGTGANGAIRARGAVLVVIMGLQLTWTWTFPHDGTITPKFPALSVFDSNLDTFYSTVHVDSLRLNQGIGTRIDEQHTRGDRSCAAWPNMISRDSVDRHVHQLSERGPNFPPSRPCSLFSIGRCCPRECGGYKASR